MFYWMHIYSRSMWLELELTVGVGDARQVSFQPAMVSGTSNSIQLASNSTRNGASALEISLLIMLFRIPEQLVNQDHYLHCYNHNVTASTTINLKLYSFFQL